MTNHFFLAIGLGSISLIIGCSSGSSGGSASAKMDSAPIVATADEVTVGWQRSFEAGYTDSSGRYAGGSEVIHIVPHKQRLYAGISYWEDSRNIWYGGSSAATGWAQVIRLDESDADWEVDLELGSQHLRTEVLKSVTFHHDGEGIELPMPVTLLIAAAADRKAGGAISVFVRDDATGNWIDDTVFSAPSLPGSQTWSPRDIEIYRDRVTGIERIFLSTGRYGVISGVYDAAEPASIRWDEFPEGESLATRPLGLVAANDSLLLSSGASLYQRNDGPDPSWTPVFFLADNINSDVGGIRGMTVIPNPNGEGESILFMWAPNTASAGCIRRLDPNGAGDYLLHDETCMRGLMKAELGVGVGYTLGAYNDLFPVVDPATGKTLNLVGFEARTDGPPDTRWNDYYRGAMYAIRNEQQEYWINEINDRFDSTKPTLVAPRTFALSPFECDGSNQECNDVLYVGGFDPNFYPSTNTAWIFRTSLTHAIRNRGTAGSD